MSLDAEVGVVGVGTMGSMTLWQLARRGVGVIGFEQFAVGHDRGAGVGETRQYRANYLEPEVLGVMAQATGLYRQLEADSGFSLLSITGGLTIGPPDCDEVRLLIERTAAAGESPVLLRHEEMRARYPQHRLAADDVVVWNAGSGFVRPEHSVVAAATTAQRFGARILPHTRVTRIEPGDGHVTVHAGDERWRVRRAVVTAGPWAWDVLGPVVPGGDLGRLVLTWFPVRRDELFRPDRFPVFTRVADGIKIYGMPSLAAGTVRVGLVGPRARFTDPGALERAPAAGELASISRLVTDWMPDLVPSVIRTGVHMDAYTPDGQPLVGALPGRDDVIAAAGFSGRGFKMAPVIGLILARLALGEPPGTDIRPWAPSRFEARVTAGSPGPGGPR
jgi:sarcosine oxidase